LKKKRKGKKENEEDLFIYLLLLFCLVDFLISLLLKIEIFWWCVFGRLKGPNVLIWVEYVWKVGR